MSVGNKMLEDTVLYGMLEADGISELKTKLIDMIVEEVRDQLKYSSEYIVSPDDIATELYEDIINEVKNEVKQEYKEKILSKLISKLDI